MVDLLPKKWYHLDGLESSGIYGLDDIKGKMENGMYLWMKW